MLDWTTLKTADKIAPKKMKYTLYRNTKRTGNSVVIEVLQNSTQEDGNACIHQQPARRAMSHLRDDVAREAQAVATDRHVLSVIEALHGNERPVGER